MKEEKFKIIDFIRQLIVNIDSNLDNFPKKCKSQYKIDKKI